MSYLNNTIENKTRDFILKEIHTTDILRPVNTNVLVSTITNPFTGQPYDGLLLTGCFAEMDIVNNNSRFYTEDNYLPFIEDLKQKIIENNGILGTLEHPKDYATNANEISHKVVDIWYVEKEKKVYGTILVLNTEKGKIVQEIYKSGSWLSISARGGGKELDQPDGTKKSVLQLLVTFDIVTHPGFTDAKMNKIINPELLINDELSNLNENHSLGINFYSQIIYSDTHENVSTEKLFESNNYLFEAKRLTKEEKSEEKLDAEKLEKNETSKKDSIENNLQVAVQSQLKQSSTELKKRIGIGSGAYYDNAAGFKTQGLNGISNPGQVGLITQSKMNDKLFQEFLNESEKEFQKQLNEGFIDGAKHIGKQTLKGAGAGAAVGGIAGSLSGGSKGAKTADKNAKNYNGAIDKKDASKIKSKSIANGAGKGALAGAGIGAAVGGIAGAISGTVDVVKGNYKKSDNKKPENNNKKTNNKK